MNVMAPDWHFGFLWEIASPAGLHRILLSDRHGMALWSVVEVYFVAFVCSMERISRRKSWHPGSWAVALYRYISEASTGKLAT